MKLIRVIALSLSILTIGHNSNAQMYLGLGGLLHCPSAELNDSETLRVGYDISNREFLPWVDSYTDTYTGCYFVSLTPYKWVEASYIGTVWKEGKIKYPDRSITLKIRPIEEGKYYPAVAVGCQDPIGSGYYTNYYVAATKHFNLIGGEWGLNVAYRHYINHISDNSKWNGVVGGITFSPFYCPSVKAIAEYDGCEFNFGLNIRLFKFVRAQIFLQNFNYISGGICIEMKNL